MIKIFVDSGSSIKQSERERYGVEILPLKIILGGKEYLDGVDLSMECFYRALIEEKQFPKTSLPSLGDAEDRVKKCIADGDDVIILTISSGISGTYNTLKMLFEDEERVRVIDTKTAVGGVRILVEEINRRRTEPLDEIVRAVEALIPRIRVVAIPDTLEYLHRGGRLSRSARTIGTLVHLKPLISLDSGDGKVKVIGKALGRKRAMEALASHLVEEDCDTSYPIVPSYTYNPKNLDMLIDMTDEAYKDSMTVYDDLDPAIACHWGPDAFGYIFVAKKAR